MNLLTSSILFLVAIPVFAQSKAPPITISSGPGETLEQALAERGVEISHESLMNALTGSDQVTQGLAADEFASQHAEDAVPYIVSAFQEASQSVPRYNLAQAMVTLKPAEGVKLMTELCQAPKEDAAVRLHASSVVLSAGLHDCDKAILEVPLLSEDPSAKLIALSLLGSAAGPRIEASDAFALEAKLLNDQNDAVRMAAASALVAGAKTEGLEVVRKRLLIETNSDVRESLLTTLAASNPAK